MDNDNHAFINIENLAASLRQDFAALPPLSEQRCIYRVPERLRQSNEKVYTPQIISIGPFHHNKEELRAMEEYKKRYLKDFVARAEQAQVSFEDLTQVIENKEPALRDCYAETIELDRENFVKMILVDAAFIIEVLLRYKYNTFIDTNDRVYNNPGLRHDIWDDMWMLENQLPFFVLDELYKKANIAIPGCANDDERPSILKLTHNFCQQYKENFRIESNFIESNYAEIKHFLDFLRISILPSSSDSSTDGGENNMRPEDLTTPSVTELYQHGVEIKVVSKPNTHMFDIKFKNGKLEIPKIKIRAATKLLLKNLLAFEQCHPFNSKYPINDYVVFIKYLVNSPRDVELLMKKGIIEYWLEDSEGVSALFRDLVQWTIYDRREFYFSSLVKDLREYCKVPWHRWQANLKQNYFNTPWAVLSVCAAMILLILTVVQTAYAIRGVE